MYQWLVNISLEHSSNYGNLFYLLSFLPELNYLKEAYLFPQYIVEFSFTFMLVYSWFTVLYCFQIIAAKWISYTYSIYAPSLDSFPI